MSRDSPWLKYPPQPVFPFPPILLDFSISFPSFQTLSSPLNIATFFYEYTSTSSNLFFFGICLFRRVHRLLVLACFCGPAFACFTRFAKRFSVSSFSLRIQRHRPFAICTLLCVHAPQCAFMHRHAKTPKYRVHKHAPKDRRQKSSL